ncbi:LD-carboxypeptidase [Fibrella sp. HMF5335]|uniref:LD-carboxypeptidase n=1 Tax=Fibrella rubiginis TaxID=2817060 RepID=A0A939K2S5_9BACT|nr:S66 peptidase family protein [Fibrella rubiginis]MBO0936624.1 LD-carboxypeptidase [Fibrella rubiginis]
MKLIKPKVLKRGDKVATISLSWGGAGELLHRYEQGKRQLQDIFGLDVVETTNALKSADYIYKNPEARANDLMESFADKSIKAIISNIGGEDSIRVLRYIDLTIIKQNPKIVLGFSDSTIAHFNCLKAGIVSFYGTSLLVGFAENGGMHQYQIDDIKRTLFSTKPVGQLYPNQGGWTSELLDWFDPALQTTKRKVEKNSGWNFLQGSTKVQGKLIGGCMEVLEFLKGTDCWPNRDYWADSILFFETSEDMPKPDYFRWWLRNYAQQGILHRAKGIILGRPHNNQYVTEYNNELLKVMREENLTSMPIITEMDFGHTCPTFTIPYGVMAEIDCINKTFSIIESGVID